MGTNSALVGPTVIGEETSIGKNVLIGPYTSIGSGCVIEDGARIFSSNIFNNVHIGADTSVSGAIVDNNTFVGNNCILETGTVIGPRCVVNDGVTVHSGVRMWPEVTIKKGEKVKEDSINENYSTSISGS
jgi:mannose-1-phosphate guanylyltransferase